jgi:hypothetical protein
VVKLADFGLLEFKKEDYSGSSDFLAMTEPHQLQQVASKCEGNGFNASYHVCFQSARKSLPARVQILPEKMRVLLTQTN